MIVLDTNIISELMKSSPSIKVLEWLENLEATKVFITTITVAEIAYGINVLVQSNRRKTLEDAFNKTIDEAFKHRLLSFDEEAAHYYAKIMSKRKELGRPMSVLDGQIAAISLSQGATLATRNIRDFSNCDLELINPF